ncbi:hypothetical protein HBI26_130190 [Parastagonospora nodorum]|nr:hypothetical protein HBI79_136780 [Parastagonospora nodorum]KAH5313788.1 hypothetical protein HBI12_136530 [Parastagonospora nodorum]KAH5579187.1 hypothetical protein HBI26_130190 [Parastagonospora nodorum]
MKIGAAPSAPQTRDASSTFLDIPHITRQTRCPPTSASLPPPPMHPAASLVLENAYKHHTLLAPLVFTIFATVTNIHQPIQHALLITAVSWLVIWLVTAFKAGIWSSVSTKRRKISGLAGACLAFAHICDRVACDKRGTWSTKGLLPLLVVLLTNGILPKLASLPTHDSHDDAAKEASDTDPQLQNYSSVFLFLITGSATTALLAYTLPATIVLGLSSAIFTAVGFVLLERATRGVEDDDTSGLYEPMHGTGTQTGRGRNRTTPAVSQLSVLRDASATLAMICVLASMSMEPSIYNIYREPPSRKHQQHWTKGHDSAILQRIAWMVPVNVMTNTLMFILLSQHGAVHTSLHIISAFILAKIHFSISFISIVFATIFGLTSFLFSSNDSSVATFIDARSSTRTVKRVIFGVSAFLVGTLLFQYASGVQPQKLANASSSLPTTTPASPFEPIPLDLSNGHPAAQLINAAETDFQTVVDRQSKSLAAAVQEYRRRYGITPPPHFDKWYEFAVRNDVVMIDEYDMINEMLLPFWAIKPATIRSRITRELGGEDSALIGVAIRDGAVVYIEKGDEWQRQATTGMLEKFVKYLPDMDLGFNVHDEPRVVVADSVLAAMVSKAQDEVLPRVARSDSPRNTFSGRPEDMNDGKRFAETYVSNFNRFSHQQTWTHSRLSCPIDSPAQAYEDGAPDNLTAFATGPLQYIYNTTAFSDICISPSLSSTFGFFERPNAFNIIHELTPIFSQSKISSFQDILYPSPWYWIGKVKYDESTDTTWENKTNALYWRGSTTGGFSRNGGWRRQHRQHVVQHINAPDTAQIVVPESENSKKHTVVNIDRRSRKYLIDVHFSHIGQCDPGDCDAQQEFFHVTDRADAGDAWYFKHLLDMDGNAFSGRFYSFLKSRSLTYKMAVFREWHTEWLKPWVHYIPLSLRGDEHLDLVRWFSGDENKQGGNEEPSKSGNGESEGERKAREIAQRSTIWHDKVLRNVDFEAWFFRLLLEYGRVVDDGREEIGYPGP